MQYWRLVGNGPGLHCIVELRRVVIDGLLFRSPSNPYFEGRNRVDKKELNIKWGQDSTETHALNSV